MRAFASSRCNLRSYSAKDSEPNYTIDQQIFAAIMDKLKKLFKHDSSDAHQESAAATHTQTAPSTTTSAQAPQTSNAGIPEKPSGVLMTTNYGDITIALYSDNVPKVCAFLQIPSNPAEKPGRLARTSPALRMQANTTMW